jgi:hypothetical protein
MINPTVGRTVWFRDHNRDDPPLAAIVTFVHNERTVNVAVFSPLGSVYGHQMVTLRQPEDMPPPLGFYCEWPSQVASAPTAQASPSGLMDRVAELERQVQAVRSFA